MYDSSEVWLECFEKNNAGREALDKIMFAKFLTPVVCTSSENPDAMRLSELGPRAWKSSLGSPVRRSNRLRDTVRSSPMRAANPAAKDPTDRAFPTMEGCGPSPAQDGPYTCLGLGRG